MSWKHAGHLISGPPSSSAPHSSSSSPSIPKHLRPNSHGLNAFQRERQLAAHYKAFDGGPAESVRSEWDVLRENHRFIRENEEPVNVSWEERLARAYESKLFKEFALIDLKHYKSRRLALRWRTAPEVVEGIGEDSCGSLRCKHHRAQPTSPERVEFDTPDPDKSGKRGRGRKMPRLKAFELPFVYEEAGVRREALVKIRLCGRCSAKLVWKPGDERNGAGEDEDEEGMERAGRESRDEDGRRETRGKTDEIDGSGTADAVDEAGRTYRRRRREEE